MNKKEIISGIAEKTGLAQKDAHAFLDGFVEVVKEARKKERTCPSLISDSFV